MKYIADRFFPVRKMPCSAKDLFNDHLQWIEDQENQDQSRKKSEKRGMTLKDVYKMGVLGQGNHFRDHDIETFSNENFLRYKYISLYLVTKIKISPKMTTKISSTEA